MFTLMLKIYQQILIIHWMNPMLLSRAWKSSCALDLSHLFKFIARLSSISTWHHMSTESRTVFLRSSLPHFDSWFWMKCFLQLLYPDSLIFIHTLAIRLAFCLFQEFWEKMFPAVEHCWEFQYCYTDNIHSCVCCPPLFSQLPKFSQGRERPINAQLLVYGTQRLVKIDNVIPGHQAITHDLEVLTERGTFDLVPEAQFELRVDVK